MSGVGEGGGIAGRSKPSEPGVGSVGVVVVAPALERAADVWQRAEQGLVQELVAQPAVEAFDEGVLDRLSRRDVMPADVALIGPGEDGVGGQLGAVVADRSFSACHAQ